jgi:hypothetical protein
MMMMMMMTMMLMIHTLHTTLAVTAGPSFSHTWTPFVTLGMKNE